MRPGFSLWLRSWLASRRVVVVLMGVLACVALVHMGSGAPGLRVTFRPDVPSLVLPFAAVTAAAVGAAAAVALQPASPEWESDRLPRTRVAHTLTWLVLALALPVTPAVLTAARLHDDVDHPASIIAAPVVLIGVHAVTLALLGSALGTAVTAALTAAAVLTEQYFAVRWPLPDVTSPPVWWLVVLCVAAGAAAQFWSAGHPPPTRRGRVAGRSSWSPRK